MFPCSSIYQNYPGTNQNLIKIGDQIQYYGQSSDQYYQYNQVLPYNNEPFSILQEEEEAVMLSHVACFPEQVGDYGNYGEKQRRRASSSSSSSSSLKRSNKDRHSKIYTAQGLRDRRMRLSLQIARKFFDLQDLLGFDKASRTIDWLFAKSQTAIDELKGPPLSTTDGAKLEIEIPKNSSAINNIKDVRRKVVVLRESRDKARARARARTREKILEKSSPYIDGNTFHGFFEEDQPNNPFHPLFPHNTLEIFQNPNPGNDPNIFTLSVNGFEV